MQWLKAGRPKQDNGQIIKEKLTVETTKWTKDELRLKRNGYVDLARAVVNQWKLDGCPQSDLVNILPWAKIVMQYGGDL